MTGENNTSRVDVAEKRVQALVTEALDLIDAYGGPPEAAVHLELALRQLRDSTKQQSGSTTVG